MKAKLLVRMLARICFVIEKFFVQFLVKVNSKIMEFCMEAVNFLSMILLSGDIILISKVPQVL